MDKLDKRIVLEVQGKTLVFNMTPDIYNKFINEINPKSKIVAHLNLCNRAVEEDCKADLKELLELPGACLHIAAALIEEYEPGLSVVVGK